MAEWLGFGLYQGPYGHCWAAGYLVVSRQQLRCHVKDEFRIRNRKLEMKTTGIKTSYTLAVVVLAAVCIVILLSKTDRDTYVQDTCRYGYSDEAIVSVPAPVSCTIFTASHGEKVLFGNNEDWINPNTYYWVVPSRGAGYGVVYFGFDNRWPQGGINEKGLAYDINALPRATLNPHPELPKVKSPFYDFLRTCSTVEEVIDQIKSHSWGGSWRAQVHVADATGDAVIISAGTDGEIAFTRKMKGNGYLVSTNFNRANPENGRHPCWRYDTAAGMLETIQDEDGLTADHFRSILDAVHVEGPSVNTVYSNSFDLRHGIIYLYHWHQFDEVVTLAVPEVIAGTPSPVRIRDLFSQETVDRASEEYSIYQGKITAWERVVWIWLILAAVSLIGLLWDVEQGTRAPRVTRLFWVLVGALFGPAGLMAYAYSYRQPLRSSDRQAAVASWRCALGETLFDVVGYAIGIILAFSTFYLILPLSESSLFSIIARVYALPLILGLLVFNAPRDAILMGSRYWNAVGRRFLTEIISLNFALTGMVPVGGILMGLCEKHLGMTGPGSPLFWGVIILSACAGALTVYPFKAWMAHQGLGCWPLYVLAGGEMKEGVNSTTSLSLRNAWGTLLMSFTFLSGSIVLVFANLL